MSRCRCVRGRAQIELGEAGRKGLHFRHERVGRGIGFLDHGGVFLGALVHDVDGRVDLVKAGRLFACGLDDRMDVGVDLLHFGDDGREGFAGLVDKRDAVL